MRSGRRDTLSGEERERKRRPFLVTLVVRLIKEKPLGTVGGVIVLTMFLAGILAPIIAPYGMNEVHPRDALSPPSAQYILGTDSLGRDLLSRVLLGARISMIVGLGAPLISVLVSLIIGGTSGFLGGRFDITVQRFVDAWMCFPPLVILLSVIAVVGQGLLQVVLVLGIAGGIGGSRIVRSTVIAIKENMYVDAAVAVGCSTTRILTRHILPNIFAPIIIIFTTRMAGSILSEAALSFLGFGIPPPEPSWGGMLSGQGRTYMMLAPWLAFWPGLALSVVVYGINMLGDAVRDILDPRLRGGLGRYGRGKAEGKRRIRLQWLTRRG